jgi:hypothetical protein
MKRLSWIFTVLGGGSCALFFIGIAVSIFSLWLYGIILAFKVKVWAGIIAVIIPIIPLIEGIVKFFGGPDLIHKIVQAIGN